MYRIFQVLGVLLAKEVAVAAALCMVAQAPQAMPTWQHRSRPVRRGLCRWHRSVRRPKRAPAGGQKTLVTKAAHAAVVSSH